MFYNFLAFNTPHDSLFLVFGTLDSNALIVVNSQCF